MLVGGLTLVSVSAGAAELTCSSDGGFNRCPLPGADKAGVRLIQKIEGTCKKDYGFGVDSDGVWVNSGCIAVFSYKKDNSARSAKAQKTKNSQCPAGMESNNCEYYKDGFNAGKEDRAIGLSNAYERHENSYDGRFESSYAQGYDKGWRN